MPKTIAKLGVVFALLGAGPVWAAPISSDLVDALQQGGYVLVMRHASSPSRPPEESAADPTNVTRERQLDERGRATAEAMGRAFRRMHIPVGEIFSSPTYRARETVHLANFGSPQTVPELGDQGNSMGPLSGLGPSAWLKTHVAEKPGPGKNTIIVTHMPNIAAAFPDQANGLEDGETLVFKPDGEGHTKLVTKIPIEDW